MRVGGWVGGLMRRKLSNFWLPTDVPHEVHIIFWWIYCVRVCYACHSSNFMMLSSAWVSLNSTFQNHSMQTQFQNCLNIKKWMQCNKTTKTTRGIEVSFPFSSICVQQTSWQLQQATTTLLLAFGFSSDLILKLHPHKIAFQMMKKLIFFSFSLHSRLNQLVLPSDDC